MRIRRLDRSEVNSASAAIFDKYLVERGNVPNMFRTLEEALRP